MQISEQNVGIYYNRPGLSTSPVGGSFSSFRNVLGSLLLRVILSLQVRTEVFHQLPCIHGK